MADSFAEAVAGPDETIHLADAALRIGQDIDPAPAIRSYLNRLDDYAGSVTKRLPRSPERLFGAHRRTALAVLNDLLFRQLHFRGDTDDYYNPDNSYLHRVMDRRLGIPITLAVVYLEVAWRAGLPLHGVGLPGHFMVAWFEPGDPLFVDVFDGGQVLSVPECQQRVDAVYGQHVPLQREWLQPVPRRYILRRILANLKTAALRQKNLPAAIGAVEKVISLDPLDVAEVRDLGVLYADVGQRWAAIAQLEKYLSLAPDAPDAEAVREFSAALFTQLAE